MAIDGDQHHDLRLVDGNQSQIATNPPGEVAARRLCGRKPPSGRRSRRVMTFAGLIIAIMVYVAVLLVERAPAGGLSSATGLIGQAGKIGTTATEQVVVPQPTTADALRALPQATTFSALPAAPVDPAPGQAPSGMVVHPTDTVPVYSAPGGPAIAALPTRQVGSDTWLPAVAKRPGWVQVLLPTRPNGVTGWLYLADNVITRAHSPYRIVVNRAAFILRLLHDGDEVGTWRIGVGKPGSVTPPGRTFLLASIKDTQPTFSPFVLPLGAHSDTYQTYGGGPGTVGIHTWPSPDVYGEASSDGCVRVPPDALRIITSQVPLGTPVMIH